MFSIVSVNESVSMFWCFLSSTSGKDFFQSQKMSLLGNHISVCLKVRMCLNAFLMFGFNRPTSAIVLHILHCRRAPASVKYAVIRNSHLSMDIILAVVCLIPLQSWEGYNSAMLLSSGLSRTSHFRLIISQKMHRNSVNPITGRLLSSFSHSIGFWYW